jgi:hypothetical protein
MTWIIKNTEFKKYNAQQSYDLFEWTEYMQNNSSEKIFFKNYSKQIYMHHAPTYLQSITEI